MSERSCSLGTNARSPATWNISPRSGIAPATPTSASKPVTAPVSVESWGWNQATSFSGKVFVYYGRDAGLGPSADVVLTSGEGGQFGVNVSTAGDMNGDGFVDDADFVEFLVAYNNLVCV